MPRLRPVATVVLIAAGGLVIGAFASRHHRRTARDGTHERGSFLPIQAWRSRRPGRRPRDQPDRERSGRSDRWWTCGAQVAVAVAGQIIAAWRALVVESGVAWHVQVHVPASLRDRELQAVLVRGSQERRASLWLSPR